MTIWKRKISVILIARWYRHGTTLTEKPDGRLMMENAKMTKNTLYRVIDNPEYADRYTLCFTGPGGPFVYGADDRPFHPLGFGQFCGEFYVPEDKSIGEEIGREDLPAGTLRLVEMIESEG